MLGTIINAATVGIGSLIGMQLNKSIPERFINIVFHALGVFTLYLGVKMALDCNFTNELVLSLLFGVVIGELIQIEKRVNKSAEKLKVRFKGQGRFTEGLTTAFILFCVGAMTIIGCFEEGVRNNREIILTKAFMDFFSSTALAAAFGKGVLFSVIPLILYQGGLTLASSAIQPYITNDILDMVRGVGGIMMIGLGLQLLGVLKIRLLNFIPAFFIGAIIVSIHLKLPF
ncbi:MAG: DUF554 domain-containing protein [Bacteroidota bacterium]